MTMALSSLPLLLALAACAAAEPQAGPESEPLFKALETGGPKEAFEAMAKLAKAFDDSMLPRLAGSLDAAPLRALQLLGELQTEGSANLLLERLPKLLESKTAEVPRMAQVACGLRRLRRATPLLLERLEDRAALRALGRIWDRALDDPTLPRKDEIERLQVLMLVHKTAMGASTSPEAVEAMLRIQAKDELEEFLSRHARDRFFARKHCDEAARKKGFDPKKGALIHEALLANPDADLVAGILESTPFELKADPVRALLKDERKSSDGRMLRELASKRLGEQ
jgi:hypothetical protein